MHQRDVLTACLLSVLVAGCGKSGNTPVSSEPAPRTTTRVAPLDGRVEIGIDGTTTTTTRPAREADTQRATLVNHTRSRVTLRASSDFGEATTVVPPQGSRTVHWTRRPGPYRLKLAFTVEGRSKVAEVATFPVR